MTEIIPGIFQLQIPIPNNPLGYTNVYLVQRNSEYLLIDLGVNTKEAFDSLERGLSEIGVSFEDIAQIVVTHSHRDHYGLSGRVKQLSHAKILMHYLEKDLINSRYLNLDETLRLFKQWLHVNGVPANELPTRRPVSIGRQGFAGYTLPDTTLRGGETISNGVFNLQVLWTPGHSPGHICLYEPTQKILFSGDHVLPVITPHVSLQAQSEDNPLVDFLNSLNIVKQLEANLVLPAHEQTFTNLQTRIEEIIRHHQQRNAEILEALKAEPKTAYQISTEITWMPAFGGARFQDLALWNKRMAVMETLAHLKAMEIDGKVSTFLRDKIIYYQQTR